MLEMVSQRDIARLCGVNDITIHRWKKTGVLPPPDAKIGEKRVAWLKSTIDMWIEMRDSKTAS